MISTRNHYISQAAPDAIPTFGLIRVSKIYRGTAGRNDCIAPRCRIVLRLSWYNLRMAKTVTTLDQQSSVALPPEALAALGIEAGAELEVEIVGRALVVRSVEEARRSAQFISAFESILSKRRTAYDELAKGPEQ
jgi:antitoxin component of MazEF toxin-antitoxin module